MVKRLTNMRRCWWLLVGCLCLPNNWTFRTVSAQCAIIQSIAQGLASTNACGCTVEPNCGKCFETGSARAVFCTSGYEYCDKDPRKSTCGRYGIQVNQQDWPLSSTYTYYSWRYTRGPNISINFDDFTFNCDVTVNKQACTKCEMISCGAPNQFKKEPSINCTNLQAGATATACSGRSAGGPVSLDESALNGILAPLAFPYLLCQRGMVVVGNATPTIPTGPTAASPPTGAPTAVVSTNDNNDCGLFKLGIFCFRGCGLIRRILGRC